MSASVLTNAASKPMSRSQRLVLKGLDRPFFPGYCELMADTGLTSYKSVDWVLDALLRRGFIVPNDHGDGYEITEAGRKVLGT